MLGLVPVGGVFSNLFLRRDIRFLSFLLNLKYIILNRDLGLIDEILWKHREIMSTEEENLIWEKVVFISGLLFHGHEVPCSL